MISMDISRMFASLQKLCVALGLMAFLMSAAPISASDAPQQRWVGDLPIMDGMTIEPELGFAFDSPGGRIVLVFAASDAETGNVMAFYNAALASLGWDGGDGNWRSPTQRCCGASDALIGAALIKNAMRPRATDSFCKDANMREISMLIMRVNLPQR